VLQRSLGREFRSSLIKAHGRRTAVAARRGEKDHRNDRDNRQHDERENERHAPLSASAPTFRGYGVTAVHAHDRD
jgi:hypothetical protein